MAKHTYSSYSAPVSRGDGGFQGLRRPRSQISPCRMCRFLENVISQFAKEFNCNLLKSFRSK